jgi:hypothetical protein
VGSIEVKTIRPVVSEMFTESDDTTKKIIVAHENGMMLTCHRQGGSEGWE